MLAIDIDPRMTAEHVKRVNARPRLHVQNVAIRNLVANQQDSYDAVVSSNVLEHIPDGIEAEVVRASYRLLKPGGVSTHWVPAMQCIYGTMKKRQALPAAMAMAMQQQPCGHEKKKKKKKKKKIFFFFFFFFFCRRNR